MRQPNITIRSLSGDRNSVVIKGIGLDEGTSEGFMIGADRITIADITMHSMRRHAVAMKPGLDNDNILDNVYVYNLNVYDTGTQHIKAADSGINRDAVIACSRLGYHPVRSEVTTLALSVSSKAATSSFVTTIYLSLIHI